VSAWTPALEPEPPSWDEDVSEAAEADDDLASLGEPAVAEEAGSDAFDALPPVNLDEGGVPSDEGVSPEEMVGAPEPEESVEPAGVDEYEAEPVEPPALDLDAEPAEEEAAPDDLFAAPPPSWDDVVEACLGLASARGAMLVDPAGQVFASRGEWPDPGADAIAAKLVPMMERTLKDSPTRSVSAPVGGQHLTAWRVPLAEGLLTAAFIGSAPVRADQRPAIDAEIRRGAGA
jgi:hypothetical protein